MVPQTALALLLAASAPAVAEPQVTLTFADPRIDESSGLATSSSGTLLYTHNDSGDEARFFAVGPDGRTQTTYLLPGVQARDWEDMARGPDEQGRSSLWIGDIGDNAAQRDHGVLVHRIPEPEPTDREQVTTGPPTSFRLRYPDGPRDAEALLVHPRTGRLYVVSKPLTGAANVYVAPEKLDPDGPLALELVAKASVRATGTPGGPSIGGLANLLVTAGDVAPDGSRVALRTYTDLYEWPVVGDDVGAAFAGEPTVTPLPPTAQGEGLAYTRDGRRVVVSSEGAASDVHVVVPRTAGAAAVASPAAVAPDEGRGALDRSAWTVPALTGLVAVVVGLLVLGGRSVRRRRRE